MHRSVDRILTTHVGSLPRGEELGALLSIEFANPRRQHEISALRRHSFPDHTVLLPGVIDSKSLRGPRQTGAGASG
jgi:hypothetical protein